MYLICSNDPINDVDNILFMLFHMYSMGFKSGEYGGKNTKSIFNEFANSMVFLDLCVLKLSNIAMILSLPFCFLIFKRKS